MPTVCRVRAAAGSALIRIRRLAAASSSTSENRCKPSFTWNRPYSIRQGERSFQWRIASVAQSVFLSEWHEVQELGILYFSVITGVMNLKVCA
jgi:hypothetical protein